MAEIKNDLQLEKKAQYRTVDELIERSQPSFSYYFLLITSSIIVGSGLLLGSSTIVLGGMLVAPVLAPIITIALGLTVGKPYLIQRESIFLLKSFVIVAGIGAVLALLFGQPANAFIFDNTVRTAVLYFVVALASGSAAALAWAHKSISDVLPGIAMAVSLVPPLSIIGIGLSALQFELTRFYFFVFLLNTVGIILGGMIIMSLLKFHRVEQQVESNIKEIKKEEEKEKPKDDIATTTS